MKENVFGFEWPTTAYVSAVDVGNITRMGYLIERHSDIETNRRVQSGKMSLHRGLLLAVWSAVHYVRNSKYADRNMVVYLDSPDVSKELTDSWNNVVDRNVKDEDLIKKTMLDCCNIASVVFAYCGTDEGGVMEHISSRMKELKRNLTI